MKLVLFFALMLLANITTSAQQIGVQPDDPSFVAKYADLDFNGKFATTIIKDDANNYFLLDFSLLPTRFDRVFFMNLSFSSEEIINIDPVIFRIGGLALRWYGLAVLLAVVAAVFVATREAKRKGFLPDEIFNLLPWLLGAGVIGARLFNIIDKWQLYLANPLEILRLEQSGLAIWGALIGGGVAVVIYAGRKHLSPGRFVDIFVPALLVGQIIGRLGCIINGDAAGGVTSLPWGFIYTNPDSLISPALLGVPTHPYPVYEMVWNAVSLLILLKLRRHFSKDGLLFACYAFLYGMGRFILSFVRHENTVLWGLQQAQVIALVIMVIAAMAFVFTSRNKGKEVNSKTILLNPGK